MLAIYKRELQSYFTSITGYLVMAAMLLFISIYYVIINLTYGYATFAAPLYSIQFIFIIIIPILTMRSIAEDRKNKTDQLLLTSPVSVSSIVLGKYLSMVSVFGLVCLISCIFPFLLKNMGSTQMAGSCSMLLAFFLFGCAAIAIGLFISSLTENQILACVGCVGVLLALDLIENVPFELPDFIKNLSLSSHLDNFYNEIFDITAIIFYLSVTAVFLFLTAQSIEKRRWGRSGALRHGSYSVLSICLSIALAVVINMAGSAMPSSLTKIDISSNKVYTLSKQSKEILKDLEQDITIYALFENNKEDDTILNLLNRYEEQSDHIKVKVVDPVKNPTFTSQYNADELSAGSVIVEGKQRYKTISDSEIYEISASAYYSGSSEQSFDGEGEITSAIDYVTAKTLPVLYYTTGHDETTLSAAAQTALTKSNYELKSLSLLSENSIPKDCSILMVLAPQADFSSDEADMIIKYLENGGKALFLTSYTADKLTQFDRILDNYGMKTSNGIIFEGDSNSYYQSPITILPQYGTHSITTDLAASNVPTLITQAAGLEFTDVRSSVTRTALLTTSDSAYEKIPSGGQFSTSKKESGDRSGQFNLGVLAEETVSDEKNTKLIVFSTPYLVDESLVSQYNISNVDLLANSIGYMCEHTSSVTIDAKSMSIETITPNAASVQLQTLVFVILLPAGLLITGIVIWLRRRKL